jgi:hypothetical protein
MVATHRTLNISAALVWYIGGFVLMIKGSSLMMEAELLKPDQHWPWTAAIVAVLIGGIKARFLFSNSCRKNLVRIAALNRPKIWQLFRPSFLMIIFLMIVVGATFSNLAHGNYPFLLGIATLDLSIAIALLGSSYVFWKHESSADN